jgi:DNA-binding response OmpR family regulator
MVKVLLVEDDAQISKSLSVSLQYGGYEVATAETVADGWSKISNFNFDVLLLDVNLPDGNGIELCKKVRDTGNQVPVLFLSARTDEEVAVAGLSVGADDYIRKPFGLEELKARMSRAMVRGERKKNVVKVGTMTMDMDKRFVSIVDKPISLGRREFDILAILVKRAGDVISREAILQDLFENPEIFDRTIDSHMSHLRKKLKDAAGETLRITSVYGVGYRLDWDRR